MYNLKFLAAGLLAVSIVGCVTTPQKSSSLPTNEVDKSGPRGPVHTGGGYLLISTPGGSTSMVPGFSSYTAGDYIPAKSNIELLEKLKATVSSIRLTTFTSNSPGNNTFYCRASFPVRAPDKASFESFIEGAMKREMSQVGLNIEDSSRQIKVHFDEIDFSSFGTGKWKFDATFFMTGKAPIKVKHEYEYPVSYGAVSACNSVTREFVPAVQSFLYAVYSNTDFVELIH